MLLVLSGSFFLSEFKQFDCWKINRPGRSSSSSFGEDFWGITGHKIATVPEMKNLAITSKNSATVYTHFAFVSTALYLTTFAEGIFRVGRMRFRGEEEIC